MNIKEIATQTDTSKDTIRFYEKQELLHPQRLANNYRSYTNSDVLDLKIIKTLRRAGVKLTQIGQILFLRHQPISQKCQQETLEFIESYRLELESKISLLQQLVAISVDLTSQINASEDNKQIINTIEQIGALPK